MSFVIIPRHYYTLKCNVHISRQMTIISFYIDGFNRLLILYCWYTPIVVSLKYVRNVYQYRSLRVNQITYVNDMTIAFNFWKVEYYNVFWVFMRFFYTKLDFIVVFCVGRYIIYYMCAYNIILYACVPII